MGYNKGVKSSNGGTHRAKLYALMLMLAFGGALLGTMLLHKFREKPVSNLVFQDKDNMLLSLQLLLQKEKHHNKELEKKNEVMKAEIYTLSGQKMELDRKVLKMESIVNSLKDEQKVMESALEEKQKELKMLQGQGNDLGKVGLEEVTTQTHNLMQSEAQITELKQHLGISTNDATIFPENFAANQTMAVQDKNEETGEHSEHLDESIIYGDVTNDATEFIKLKNGQIFYNDQIQDGKENNGRLIETYEHDRMQEKWQVEGTSGGRTASKEITDEYSKDDDGAGLTSKYLNGRLIKEEQRGQDKLRII
ncbi:hypothetical protein RIF29_05712 [Crotalaria pallida]|uniref:Uncharacterized protein n=1 Tax=Crotalaria pallida TaxID=3830 RepID=A0AAN9J338_CROPI